MKRGGQRRDDRRKAQQLDQSVVRDARAKAHQQRHAQPDRDGAGRPVHRLQRQRAASVIVAGIDRSTLPGPSVITNICPSPTMSGKGAEGQRGIGEPAVAAPPVSPTISAKAAGGGDDRTRARAFAEASSACSSCPASRRLNSSRSRQHQDQDRPLRPDLPVGRQPEEVQERRRQRQRQRPDHRADGLDPPAGELAAAQDHARDGSSV